MFIAEGKMRCIKRCELSSIVIRISVSCLLGGCIYNLDRLIGAILQLINIKYIRSTKYDEKG